MKIFLVQLSNDYNRTANELFAIAQRMIIKKVHCKREKLESRIGKTKQNKIAKEKLKLKLAKLID